MATVLITGGSRGIGAACVRYYAEKGDRVAFFYQKNHDTAKALVTETGAIAICVDVRDSEAVKKGIAEAHNALGRFDILICNAGISQIKLFDELTDADWKNMLDTNLNGAFYTAREVTKCMLSQHSGSILFIGSMWGRVGASCEVHYSAAKAALRGMTKALAKELGPSSIRVNCIEPGLIMTDMNASLDESTVHELREETPLSRVGETHEVASAAYFLTSPEASFITGQILGVDGGYAL